MALTKHVRKTVKSKSKDVGGEPNDACWRAQSSWMHVTLPLKAPREGK